MQHTAQGNAPAPTTSTTTLAVDWSSAKETWGDYYVDPEDKVRWPWAAESPNTTRLAVSDATLQAAYIPIWIGRVGSSLERTR